MPSSPPPDPGRDADPGPGSDGDDVRRTLRGDRQAYGRLFDRHAAGVRAVAAAVAGLDAVEDVTQESFLRAYQRLPTLRDPALFGEWVRGVARRVGRERRRQLQRTGQPVAADPIASPADGPLAAAISDEEQRLVLTALARLPERERLALHAYYFAQQQAAAAAADLGLSRSGYYAVLQRALKQLRALLPGAPATPGKGADDACL